MKVALLGGGLMGEAILFDLLNYQECEEIRVFEKNAENIEKLWKRFKGYDFLSFVQLDVLETEKTREALLGSQIIISALPYQYNLQLLELALEIGAHFLDLGGNESILNKQLALHEKAQKLKLIALPACGLAPGLVSILAADGIKQLDKTDSIRIYCGGLPQNPRPPLNYQIVFSPHGLINEYLEPVKVIEDGEVIEREALSDLETVHFHPPYTPLEAFLTSGGTGTLVHTLQGKIKNLTYKTLRYPGHAEKMKFLFALGFDSDEPRQFPRGEVSPREMLERMLKEKLTYNDPDVVLTRVIVQGQKENQSREVHYELVDLMDKNTNLTAMMRTTGFSAAICAQMIMNHHIQEYGVLPLENCIPTDLFIQELNKRGLIVNKNVL